MKGVFFILVLLFSFCAQAQLETSADSLANDKYFEDQFYIGVSYNFVRHKPDDFKQRNLSYGLQAGLIKDIPLNKNSTRAIGIGMGLALNTYYSNLKVVEASDGFSYSIDSGSSDFKRSKLETHLVEFPLEFRWRNSTRQDYKFWRVYAGVKAAYVIGARSKLVTTEYRDGFFNTDVAKFQYGLTLNFGYNTFNVHAYYALSDLFDNAAQIDGNPIGFRPLRIGIIFYIL
ncbi:PorT family protein [Maribacter sp. MMG018]|uniref:porin family protein n=1 Tax=Maribacter sp. MMG018 TaxID=2822688 RepID=UPI001B362CBB|nr:porin family protein [Maribacter sp. MMG018]MBQ4913955.1 PorT family protein [Maribacter sp. MMG018]